MVVQSWVVPSIIKFGFIKISELHWVDGCRGRLIQKPLIFISFTIVKYKLTSMVKCRYKELLFPVILSSINRILGIIIYLKNDLG